MFDYKRFKFLVAWSQFLGISFTRLLLRCWSNVVCLLWLWWSPIRFLRSIACCGIWRRRRSSNRRRLQASRSTTSCACSTARLVAGRGIQELRLQLTRLWLCLTVTFRPPHYQAADITWFATIHTKEVSSLNFHFFFSLLILIPLFSWWNYYEIKFSY